MLTRLLSLLLLFFCVHAVSATPAPDFTITTTDGVQRSLYADYVNQGKVLVFEIFFTSCPPCNTHAPFWQTFYQNMQATHPGQVECLILSTQQGDLNSVVGTYRTNKGLTMPGAGSDGGSITALQPYISSQFGTFFGTPTFVVIAPGTGEVHFDIRGTSPQNTMNLLAQKVADLLPVTPPAPVCHILSPYGNGVEEVAVQVTAGGGYEQILTSDSDGGYTIDGLQGLPATYTVTPTKDSDILEGMSTFDLVQILKHILDIQPFTEPWQLVAADLNCSGSITTFDIATGRKFILGIYTESPDCPGTWAFDPPTSGPLSGNACADFMGIRRGDLTGNYLHDVATDRSALLWAQNARVKRGDRVRLLIHSQEGLRLLGLQLGLGFDAGRVRIGDAGSDMLPGFDRSNVNLNREGYLPVSWTADRPVDVGEGVVLLTLSLEILEDGLLSDMVYLDGPLRAEAYPAEGRPVELSLAWRENRPAGAETAHRIHPNPNRGVFTVVYEAQTAERVVFELLDAQGRTALRETHAVQPGANRIWLDMPVRTEGLYTLRANGQVVGRVVVR